MSTTQQITPAEAFESLPGYHRSDDDLTYGPGERTYIGWAPGDDCMWTRDDRRGWDTPQFYDSWEEFRGQWSGFDDLNVVADFYFRVDHDSVGCEHCDGSGYGPEARIIGDSFYRHSCPPGETVWADKLTQADVDLLIEKGRLRDLTHTFVKGEGWVEKDAPPTPAEVNAWEREGFGHDAINRLYLIEGRCERAGVPVHCEHCEGEGRIRTSEDYLVLNLWMLHPRKGASRGINIKRVPVEALDEVREWLRTSREIQTTWWAWVDGEAS